MNSKGWVLMYRYLIRAVDTPLNILVFHTTVDEKHCEARVATAPTQYNNHMSSSFQLEAEYSPYKHSL